MAGESTDAFRVLVEGRMARIALNRPERRNALDVEAMRALGDAIDEVTHREAVGCLVLTGSGGSFCAGADLPAGGATPTPEGDRTMMDAVERVVLGITTAPMPVIAQVDGAAAGVGASLAIACDLIYASSTAFFLLPFAGIGLIPDGAATRTLAATVGRARAMRMALLQERLPAAEAFEAGLVAGVVEADELEAHVTAIAGGLADGATRALGTMKAIINEHTIDDLTPVLRRETEAQLPLLQSWEYREGVTAFRERRRPDFRSGGPN